MCRAAILVSPGCHAYTRLRLHVLENLWRVYLPFRAAALLGVENGKPIVRMLQRCFIYALLEYRPRMTQTKSEVAGDVCLV